MSRSLTKHRGPALEAKAPCPTKHARALLSSDEGASLERLGTSAAWLVFDARLDEAGQPIGRPAAAAPGGRGSMCRLKSRARWLPDPAWPRTRFRRVRRVIDPTVRKARSRVR